MFSESSTTKRFTRGPSLSLSQTLKEDLLNASLSTTTRRFTRGPPPSLSQTLKVAHVAVSTLKKAGVDACFIGSMACLLLGATRKPNDLDILCLSNTLRETEALKRQLVALEPHFYLVDARKRTATYKVLWYHIQETDSRIKVDLLMPGDLDIPAVPLSVIDRSHSSGLPSAPLSHVLLLKLQGWIHHGDAVELRYRRKQPIDVQDVSALLVIARLRGVQPRSESYLPEAFISRAALRVIKYVHSNPNSKEAWKAVGFSESW
ncbi:hypothetical protein K439DRAFT_1397847 [Ramaria rubella]|nr:hypothetical protein K439DRAFT_1397847 [Ramaria rubella]